MLALEMLAIALTSITLVSGQQPVSGKEFLMEETTISGEYLKAPRIDSQSQREGKFFPLFSVVRFANNECSGSNNFQGTCFTANECKNYGGTSYGTCAGNLGVCCVFRKSCGTTTNMNNTYFVNPDYPMTYSGGETCTLEVFRCNSDICQLRIDFLDLSLAQPNANGVCDQDFLLISRGSTTVPRICGENSNQHVYVDFNGANSISVSLVTNSDFSMARRWNLRIQQIACDSPWRAPLSCLQYYKTIDGTVSSFNYGTVSNPRVLAMLGSTMGTRQMQNLNYGVCVRMAAGYCTIEWSQSDSLSFAISGDTGVLDPTAGTDFAVSGMDCDHNFVVIPNPSVSGVPVNVDRFCGNGFVTTTSSSKPFVMYVVTNPGAASAANDFENRGFILKYRQIPCSL
ncbi:uncharacterized protein [Venturia canescens]|uniref:uncharacterized protein n=1 Tax=Venturia canescens TaxID=32260 RepID=UPI001C9C1C0F|nr:uncharacterized protein LOC122417672 [Venturia canescens]